MTLEIQNKIKEIKSKFRLSMNGVVAQSMREKGLGYKINWGISLPVLKKIATDYGKDYDLAVGLWREDVRECKILATLIMPVEEMPEDIVELWVGQIDNQEIAEIASFNLFQYVRNAKATSMRWIASENVIKQICGYQIISRLLLRNEDFTEREINEVLDQAQAAMEDGNISVRHAIVNMLSRFAAKGTNYRKILKSAFKSSDLDIF